MQMKNTKLIMFSLETNNNIAIVMSGARSMLVQPFFLFYKLIFNCQAII